MNTKSSRLTPAEFREIFTSRPVWYDDIIDLMFVMYRFGRFQAKQESPKLDAREAHRIERIGYLRGMIKVIKDCGFWAPEMFPVRLRMAEEELKELENYE